ncbi:MAG: glycogen debranching protein GlgX [Azospirillaceae bacterium]
MDAPTPLRHRLLPGRPYPLGATWDGHGVNIALFSANAESVELCLFDESGQREVERIALGEKTDDVWHGYLPDLRPGRLYGFRVHGPYAPEAGHRFNPNKLLLDPYARSLSGPIRWTDAHYGYRIGSGRADLSFDRRDNARSMVKARVVDPAFTWGGDRRPDVPWTETLIYEAHVRGLTKRFPQMPPAQRGTFAALGRPEVTGYLKDLGVTAIELLPVHAFHQDRFLTEKGLINYWGYSTLAFFAPEPRYVANGHGAIGEFRSMVRGLHEAGIEVILDVVYNHTCEGNHLGPTFSLRGIDNASYYRLKPGDPRHYADDTGTGNALNLAHPRVLQMVMDSLRYWVTEMHVDGFRFDLASTLGREAIDGKDGGPFDPRSGFFDAVRQDPVLNRVKLIAEPWDIGPGGYQLGNYPTGWAEWNDRFRDTVRRFWRGDRGIVPELAGRLTGSADVFERNGRRPWSSINAVACHDGFTLADLVRYADKHNEANGEHGRDGHDHNFSANYGEEGPTADPARKALRKRQQRNLMASVLLSQGTPMILAGDEFGRTQYGNNNAYCQDNEISWVDWSFLHDHGHDGADLHAFTKRLIALRREHPVLRRPRFLHGREVSPRGLRDILWLRPDGQERTEADWKDPQNRAFGLMLSGDAGTFVGADGQVEVDSVLLIIANAHAEALTFVLPRVPGARGWTMVVDTMTPTGEPAADRLHHAPGADYRLDGRCLAVFELDD